jgi:hypothetical protein
MLIALRQTRREILRNPFRSFLVLQGIVWGTVLAILPPALFQGSRSAALERAADLGTDRIVIIEVSSGGKPLDWDVPAVLAREVGSDILAASAYAPVPFPKEPDAPPVILMDTGAQAAGRRELSEGRWPTDDEIAAGASVAVLEPAAAERLRRSLDLESASALVGREVSIAADLAPVRVVGIAKPRRETSLHQDLLGYEKDHPLSDLVYDIQDSLGVRPRQAEWLLAGDAVLVPRRLRPEVAPLVVELRADPIRTAAVARKARDTLLERGTDPIIFYNTIVEFLFGQGAVMIERFHWVVFCGCILVGSAAVACLRILTVLERREEIAIRRVEGATLVGIGAQIAIETSAFCLAGAVAGLPLAFLLAWIRVEIDPSSTVTWIVPVPEVLITLACVVLVGLLAGLLPALRAAALEPAQVLGGG